jgi:hypothetical protein
MRLLPLGILVVLLVPSPSRAAGFAHNENFTVFAPAVPSQEAGQAFAEELLAKADQYRKEIATYWLGEELPPGVGHTIINVDFTGAKDTALTWVKDNPRRKYHTLYLSTSPERALGSTLAHEVSHVVLATRFPHPNRLAAWLEEGIAGKYDDALRIQTRRKLLSWFSRTGNWPRLEMILTAEEILAKDECSYAVATSLTDFLISLRDKGTLLAFGRSAGERGWDAALRKHYGISDVSALQADWRRWVALSR